MIYHRKPIMSAELERQVLNAVTMFTKAKQWKLWGLHHLREQGSAILLKGPPGCGKTVIAEWLALKIRKKGLIELSFADFGSGDPGGNSRNIRDFFEDARKRGWMTIYFDECDAVLGDRNKLGPDAQWMLEVINEILIQTSKYKGLVIFSTNRPQALDKALWRRILAEIDVPIPAFEEREKLWKVKMPDAHPLKITTQQIAQIATLQLTGAEIETVIINISSDVIRRDIKPTYSILLKEAKAMEELARKTDAPEA